MSILDTILGYEGDHPKDVAQAYHDVKQQIAQDVGARENEQWRSLFDSAKLHGASPADLHNPATGANAGSTITGPSELERWKMQIDGLITSGNPVLQQQGLGMLGAYQQRATAPESKTDNRTMGAKYADELGLTGKARLDFISNYANKSGGTTVNVGDQSKKGSMLTPGEKVAWGLDPDASYAHTDTGPKPINNTSYTAAQLDSAGYASRMEQAEQTLLALDEAGFDPTTINQKLGDMAGSGSGYVLSPTQQVHKQAADTWIRNKLRDESGATIGDEEMAREYTTYFPQPGESRSVVYAKQLARAMAIKTMAEASGGKYKKEDFAEAEALVKMAMDEDLKWKKNRQGLMSGPKQAISNMADPNDPNWEF